MRNLTAIQRLQHKIITERFVLHLTLHLIIDINEHFSCWNNALLVKNVLDKFPYLVLSLYQTGKRKIRLTGLQIGIRKLSSIFTQPFILTAREARKRRPARGLILRKGNSNNSWNGWDRGVSVPGAFKLDHLQPFKPILFWQFLICFILILGGKFGRSEFDITDFDITESDKTNLI